MALENSPSVLAKNMERNRRFANIHYMEFHSVLDDWKVLPKVYNRKSEIEAEERQDIAVKRRSSALGVDFMLIDAAHDKAGGLLWNSGAVFWIHAAPTCDAPGICLCARN